MSNLVNVACELKNGQKKLMLLNTQERNEILQSIKNILVKNADKIISENKKDLQAAEKNGMSAAMLDRLTVDKDKINAIAKGIAKVIALPDPIGSIVDGKTLPIGMELIKKRVPLGVIGMIYESRPNVTVDSVVLCLKSGNAVLLRGGKEAITTNTILVNLMKKAVMDCGLSGEVVGLVEDTSREVTVEMMKLRGYLDVLIPRGGAGLIQSVVENATVPVIETGVGNCHIYVDEFANLEMATDILFNAKTSRPSVCNACESLLVHKSVASQFLPMAQARLDQKSVKILGCERTATILGGDIDIATEDDYATEFLDFILSVKVVDSMQEAVDHIDTYGTKHSEAIITEQMPNAIWFVKTVDASAVYINASTRFTDGEEFGMGAEIGISTQKLHARGPMGLPELTTIKYILIGKGNVR